ncbi:MAG: MBL fold metallo-hydrolase [Akkermansia sp.]|nr:MBL fold metallo-hydrolase [Akkermansia sp.]
MMKVVFLGSGTSTGVPVIGCECAVCKSENPRNKRLRSSVLVQSNTTTLLVDSCPDLREQALRHRLTAIDGVIYTHEHLDHTAGFDEMRAFCWRRTERLPLYAGTACLAQLRNMFGWAFSESNTYQGYIRPAAHDHAGDSFVIGDIAVTPVPVIHATVETYGYVFRSGGKSFGYVPDIQELPESSRPLLEGLDALAMDGLRFRPHRTHFNVEQNIALMQQLRPGLGLVTHCGHEVDFEVLSRLLPDFMQPAWDGLMIEL